MRITVKKDSSPPRWIWVAGAALAVVIVGGAVAAFHHPRRMNTVTPASQPRPAATAPAPAPKPAPPPEPDHGTMPIGGQLDM